MTKFIPVRTNSENLDNISRINGQMIFVIDTKKIYIDIDNETRREIGGIEGVDFLTKENPEAIGAFGLNCDENYTLGNGSIAAGNMSVAEADNSFAFGDHSYAASELQTVIGRYNIIDDETKFALIVGNGTSDANRKNILTIDWEGNVNIQGTITDGKGNSLNEVLNFDTLSRMMTSGKHTGISIEEDTDVEGNKVFNFTIESLPEIAIDAEGYWTIDGERGINPTQARGFSAYEVAVQNGFVGTEVEWLASLRGEPGKQTIETSKVDLYCTLLADNWTWSIPFRQTVTVNGITSALNPRVDIVVDSEDIALGKKQVNFYNCITRIETGEGTITAECYETRPDTDINLMIEVV